jgi:hypothetical protein
MRFWSSVRAFLRRAASRRRSGAAVSSTRSAKVRKPAETEVVLRGADLRSASISSRARCRRAESWFRITVRGMEYGTLGSGGFPSRRRCSALLHSGVQQSWAGIDGIKQIPAATAVKNKNGHDKTPLFDWSLNRRTSRMAYSSGESAVPFIAG